MRFIKPKYLPLFIFFSVFFFSLAVYILTLNKYVILGDSGEFITASFEAGVPHPPGYPLFTLIGLLFTKIPIGNIVQRVGFVSALFGSATVGLLGLFLYKITSSKIASVVGALALAFSSIFWLYSVNAEIITLNTFFLVLLLLLTVIYTQTKKDMFWYLLTLTTGLSLANQFTVVTVFPALAFLLFPARKEIFQIKKIMLGVACFLAGLSFYLYLPIAAAKLPYVNWDNPSNLEGFISLVTRKYYGYLKVGDYAGGNIGDILLSQIPFYFKNTLGSFGIVAVFLFLFGLIPLRGKNRRAHLAIMLAFFFSGPFLVGYSNFSLNSPFPDVAINQVRTMQTVYVISTPFIASFIALGIANLEAFLKRYKTVQSRGPTILIGILAFGFPLILNYQPIKDAGNAAFDFYGRSILTSLPGNSLLVVGADNTYIFWYLQVVENLKKDIPVINFSLMQSKWYVDQLKERYPGVDFPFNSVIVGQSSSDFYQQNLKKYQIFFSPLDDQSRSSIPPSVKLIQDGLMVQLLPQDKELDINTYKEKQDESWRELEEQFYLFQEYKDLPTQEILMAYARAWANIGITYENYDKEDWAIQAYERARKISPAYYLSTEKLANLYLKQDEKDYAGVIPLYQEILKFNPTHPLSLRNLGAIYAESGRYKEAEKLLKRYLDKSKDSKENELIRQIYEQARIYAY